MLVQLLLRLSDSQAGQGGRLTPGAGKHTMLVRANLDDNCVVPGLPGLAGEPESRTQSPAAASPCWARGRAGFSCLQQGSGGLPVGHPALVSAGSRDPPCAAASHPYGRTAE